MSIRDQAESILELYQIEAEEMNLSEVFIRMSQFDELKRIFSDPKESNLKLILKLLPRHSFSNEH